MSLPKLLVNRDLALGAFVIENNDARTDLAGALQLWFRDVFAGKIETDGDGWLVRVVPPPTRSNW